MQLFKRSVSGSQGYWLECMDGRDFQIIDFIRWNRRIQWRSAMIGGLCLCFKNRGGGWCGCTHCSSQAAGQRAEDHSNQNKCPDLNQRHVLKHLAGLFKFLHNLHNPNCVWFRLVFWIYCTNETIHIPRVLDCAIILLFRSDAEEQLVNNKSFNTCIETSRGNLT